MLTTLLSLALTAFSPKEAPPENPVPIQKTDDPTARREATLEWLGGGPSLEFLDAKKELWGVDQKARKRYTGRSPGWKNLGPTGGDIFGAKRGPDSYSGRLALQGIVPDPTNPRVLYVASTGGGVWKTTNADLNNPADWNWTPITDNLPVASALGNISCGALAISPWNPDFLYLGLGALRCFRWVELPG